MHPADLPIQYISWVRLGDHIFQTFGNFSESALHLDHYPNISTAISNFLSNEIDALLLNFPIEYVGQQKSLDNVLKEALSCSV